MWKPINLVPRMTTFRILTGVSFFCQVAALHEIATLLSVCSETFKGLRKLRRVLAVVVPGYPFISELRKVFSEASFSFQRLQQRKNLVLAFDCLGATSLGATTLYFPDF